MTLAYFLVSPVIYPTLLPVMDITFELLVGLPHVSGKQVTMQNPRLLALLPTAFHTQWVTRVGSRGRHSSVFSRLRQTQGQKAGGESWL